ncbi:PhnD/SsuA/transferrin family substrate-binding protein [Undibacterium piscinae]|uniref:PhnD/SsuA/transferrin family substrate-binding protein n=1 Tax=Undibacterium piscinae TaxID=2495591 RepID=A0A6M4A6N0_9BURK|nr:PhnD/SsuA/transferrin family substrate-binding protein [Undibacterium piscinae]
MSISQNFRLFSLALAFALPLHSHAQIKVLIGNDPADESKPQALAASPTPSLTAALGSQVVLKQTTDLTEVMRASRTQENDILIVPPHATASAISHSYDLLARNKQNTQFVLIVRKEIERAEQMKGKRLYLPQQDSARTYLAKGLLAEDGLSMKSFQKTSFGKTSGAGLLALSANLADVTIAEQEEAKIWMKKNPDIARILKATRSVPSGVAVMVRKNMADSDRKKLLKWIASPDSSGFGKLQTTNSADEEQYRYIASLGILTPDSIPGVTKVTAEQVAKLLTDGAVAVDTRSAKEYEQEHIIAAIHAPYLEKSLKDREYDATMDDFSALSNLPLEKALIFYCNGPECWKSYKASIAAKAKGVKKIYWYRNGMPEWREKSLPLATK